MDWQNDLNMHTEERIINLISKLYDIPVHDISMNSHLKRDLGLDSLDLVEVLMECEQMYEISFPDSELEEIHYVEDIVGIVNEYQALFKDRKNKDDVQ
jgi:acyl carrier protein